MFKKNKKNHAYKNIKSRILYMKKTNCECGSSYRSSDRKRHELTKVHLDFIKTGTSSTASTVDIYEDDSVNTIAENVDLNASDFLIDLNNDKYISPSDIEKQKKEEELQRKEDEKNNKLYEKNIKMLRKVKPVVVKEEDIVDDEIFSSTPTPIHGVEKLILLKKVQQYKVMFKQELKSFKIKKNPNIKELQDAIDEMMCIIETRSTDEFITDGILHSLKVVEGVSANTKNYNITGLSDMLKLNVEFRSLCKQLYLKHGSFASISPEYKMMFLVFTTAYICRNKNIHKQEINNFLDQPIEINYNNIN